VPFHQSRVQVSTAGQETWIDQQLLFFNQVPMKPPQNIAQVSNKDVELYSGNPDAKVVVDGKTPLDSSLSAQKIKVTPS